MKILIAGAGRLGEQAAYLLAATGHQVTVIDRDRTRLTELGGEHVHRLVHGDACELSILESAGALNTDLLLAATGEDEDNLVIALLAQRQFAVPRTVARVNDPDNAWLFDTRWGVDVALSATSPLVSLIEEATGATDTVGLAHLAAAGVTLIETHIDDHSKAAGHPLTGISLPPNTIMGAVVHDGQPRSPNPSYRLQPGDTVLVVSTSATEADIHNAFQ